jgi:hypothetical protein
MARFTLEVTSARLLAGFGVPEDPSWRILLNVKPKWPKRLKLGTGEMIGGTAAPSQFEMKLTLREAVESTIAWASERTMDVRGRDDLSPEAPPVGIMQFNSGWASRSLDTAHPASVTFDAFVPREVMASMIRFAESGRFINDITVEVRGLEYGSRSDRDIEWPDNDTVHILPVTAISYFLPLIEEPDDEPGVPKTPVGADLAPLLKDILQWVKGVVLVTFVMCALMAQRGCG